MPSASAHSSARLPGHRTLSHVCRPQRSAVRGGLPRRVERPGHRRLLPRRRPVGRGRHIALLLGARHPPVQGRLLLVQQQAGRRADRRPREKPRPRGAHGHALVRDGWPDGWHQPAEQVTDHDHLPGRRHRAQARPPGGDRGLLLHRRGSVVHGPWRRWRRCLLHLQHDHRLGRLRSDQVLLPGPSPDGHHGHGRHGAWGSHRLQLVHGHGAGARAPGGRGLGRRGRGLRGSRLRHHHPGAHQRLVVHRRGRQVRHRLGAPLLQLHGRRSWGRWTQGRCNRCRERVG